MKVFVDSGGWLSVLIETDKYHEQGKGYFEQLIAQHALLFTSDYVLDEVITRLRYDVSHNKAAEFLALSHQAADSGILIQHQITQEIWNAAEAIFLNFTDVRFSFTDCTSFALLNTVKVDEVFGYDAHFEMMGHILKPKA